VGSNKRIQLSSQARILHDWIAISGADPDFTFDLAAFQIWAEEHTGEKQTLKELRATVSELEHYGLIEVLSETLKVRIFDIPAERFKVF
jgi:hypothetical protein